MRDAAKLSRADLAGVPSAAAPPPDAPGGVTSVPVAVLLHNVRSLYNVGAFFRTADAAGVRKLYLCGFTATPPHRGLAKTALGAEATVAWEAGREPTDVISEMRAQGYQVAAVETSPRAVDIFDWMPTFPVCVLFGHEVDGLSPALLACCDTHVRLPMLGAKRSLNVATAGGIVLYELLRKYRGLAAKDRESV